MYFFTNFDERILGDTFLCWYDRGDKNYCLYKGFYTLSDLMLSVFKTIPNSENRTIVKVDKRYFEFIETAFGYNDYLIREVEMNKILKLQIEWKVKE